MGNKPAELVRTLSVFQGVALAVSLVIGSGVLGLPGIVLAEIEPQHAALAWLGTAVAMVPFIIVFCGLGIHFPSAPGLLFYAECAFGRAGRNAASLMLLSCVLVGFPALVLIGGSFVQALAGLDALWAPALAAGILALAAAFNLAGLRTSARFNGISVVLLIAFMLLVSLNNADDFRAGAAVVPRALSDLFRQGPGGLRSVWTGCALIFWAFLGWENLGFGVQEIKNPRRALPLIFGLSFLLVTVLFLMPAFTSIGAAIHGRRGILGAAGLVSLLDQSRLRPLCAVVIIVVIIGNANAWMYTVSRMLFAEASDGLLPRRLSHLSSRQVPDRCLIVCFLVVMASIGICWLADIRIARLMLLVNQNLLILFLVSIWAYAKVETSPVRWPVAAAALVTCSLFLSGFSYWILFPAALLVAGIALDRRRRARTIPSAQ